MFEIYISEYLICSLHDFEIAITATKLLSAQIPDYLVEIRENNTVLFRKYTVSQSIIFEGN
jgi:hypothetical protein